MSPSEVAALYITEQPRLVRFLTKRGEADEAPDLAHATWAHFYEVVTTREIAEPVRFLFRVAQWKAAKHRRFRARTGRLLPTLPLAGREHPVLTPVSGTWKSRRATGSTHKARGEKHGRSKYPDSLLPVLREAYARLGSYTAVAKEHGMSRPTVIRFLTGVRKVSTG